MEELKKVFEVMHVLNAERVKFFAYQLKGVVRTWFDNWKDGIHKDAPHLSRSCFEEAFLGHIFP